ncbi:MAG: excinuclease ABC subunit UvrC [Deltaproteobacteria bacterium]|nr:excinuclease ABC subunit UvrC [Deltaproteobacteria bacterium]MCL4873691.1 excinuclease ABC subunit UvrC [bacterium]
MTAIEEKLAKLPQSPGVYMMKGPSGEVLYIGKAKDLRARVRSYFREGGDGRYAVRFLSSRTADIDYIVTTNEKEALLLEDTLLKRHKPRYNIRLKDSKTYVSIKITMKEKFPRILVTRQRKKDGSRYFGPYISAREVRDTIKFIRRIFPLCVCSEGEFRNRVRPCLDYQIGLCAAPAAGLISEEAYRELVDGAIMFLEGKNRELLKMLREKMKEASAALEFEKAARLRDRVLSIEGMLEEQKVVAARAADQDVFAFIRERDSIVLQALHIRDGRLTGGSDYFFHDAGLPDEEILSSFIAEYYRGERFVPDEAIIQAELDDRELLEDWLSEKKGRRAAITMPQRGGKAKLLQMARSNAAEALRKRSEAAASRAGVIVELQKRLRLKGAPHRIEAFDISNIGGSQAVGAMVAFKDGEPDKDSYRLFRIRGLEGPDDYAMMYQVLSRRFLMEGAGKGPGFPDLVLVDGGKGQLNIAIEALKELGVRGVEVRALAKDRENGPPGKGVKSKGERIFIPGVKDPILLKEGSKPDLLVRRIRDEVHRSAISYHRKLRSKELGSLLDRVPGIGGKKKKALFERFGDLESILNADLQELTSIPGITERLAEEIKKLKDSGRGGE